jgi:hypothetical protein
VLELRKGQMVGYQVELIASVTIKLAQCKKKLACVDSKGVKCRRGQMVG